MTLRNVAINFLYYAVTLVALPAGALWLEARWSAARDPVGPLQVVGVLLGTVGAGLQAWCIVLLQAEGRGTPSPLVPTTRLVTRGPYAWVRNPINVGEVLVLVGLAAWFASWFLLAYALLAAVAFHVFILLWEEPRHRRLFEDPYTQYVDAVPRWWPAGWKSMMPR